MAASDARAAQAPRGLGSRSSTGSAGHRRAGPRRSSGDPRAARCVVSRCTRWASTCATSMCWADRCRDFCATSWTLMPTEILMSSWDAIAARLEGIPTALDRIRSSFEGLGSGSRGAAGPPSGAGHGAHRRGLRRARRLSPRGKRPALRGSSSSSRDQCRRRCVAGESARGWGIGRHHGVALDCAAWLPGEVYAPAAVRAGRRRPRPLCHPRPGHCRGADIDPEETNAWGWEELARITRRMNDCAAKRLYGGVTPMEAQERLDVRPRAQHDPRDGRAVHVPGLPSARDR